MTREDVIRSEKKEKGKYEKRTEEKNIYWMIEIRKWGNREVEKWK